LRGSEATEAIYIGSLYEVEGSVAAGFSLRKHIFMGSQRIATISLSQGGEGQGEGATSYYHSDHLGSSNLITDSNGAQVGLTEFTPYGSVSKQTGAYDPKYKFTGKELDNTGLYFYGARYYDPEIGRFINADTIVQSTYDPQSLNRYSYCRNNPINYTDPTGHSWFSKFFKKVGDFFSNVGKSIADNPLAFVAGIAVGIGFGILGAGLVQSFLLPSMSIGGISVAEGAIMTGLEFGIGGFGSGLASGLASGQDLSSSLKNARYGFAGGFIAGSVIGATYTAGWQNWIHGVDSQKINNLHSQAKGALTQGNFGGYVNASEQLLGMNATPPGAVLQGKSPLALGIKHSYLVAAKDAQFKAKGFGPESGWQAAASKIPVPGIVRTETAATLASSIFEVQTWDLVKVTAVWGNMDKIQFPIYQLDSKQINCYGWTNAVLTKSGLPPVNPRDVW
jgi:RHS repeat-associated protein